MSFQCSFRVRTFDFQGVLIQLHIWRNTRRIKCLLITILYITSGPKIVIREKFFCHVIEHLQIFNAFKYVTSSTQHHLWIFTKSKSFRTLPHFYHFLLSRSWSICNLRRVLHSKECPPTHINGPREMFAVCDFRILVQVSGKCSILVRRTVSSTDAFE